MNRKWIAGCTVLISVAMLVATASAQSYPQRPVRVVVPVTAGGGVDAIARLVSDQMSQTMGQRFVVDNRPGAGGTIGVEIVANAAPDGHTLLVSSSSLVTNAAVQSVRYDPVRDFRPVTKLTMNAYILVAAPSFPPNTIQELLAYARAKPGAVTYASSGTGGVLHLGGEMLCLLGKVQMTHVPFKGVADGYPAVIGGQVNWILGNPLSAMPLIKAGRLKAYAVTSGRRSSLLPELPTIAESGVPGYDVTAWFSLFAPAKTPEAVVQALYREASRAVQSPEIAKRMAAEGTEVSGNPPAEFAREVREEYAKWQQLVKTAGLRAN